ncbi:O-antigen ligase [Cupriavidus sp. YR651]|uniref:PglL family O-oligosaccharyltransferase n=1 Tax=Cupriavidus sp. YR651 TaxID=1855315 RepID=UPI000889D832|nr:O-antigen ligase family protein [Cupriavidus sp. YR651]SDC46827.1 O-antigen ligase [Cupriavidus sp. YR651]
MPPSRVSLPATAIVVAFTLPLLVSKHTLPLATFYGEWTAGLLGAVLVLLLAFHRSAPPSDSSRFLPWIALLPLWLIATTILQAATGMEDVSGSRFTTQIVLALGASMMFAAWRTGQGLSPDERVDIADAIAIAFVVAGLLGTLAQWIQVFHMEDQAFGLVSAYFYDDNRRLWGNLNQPNHQATVQGLALAASIWLASRGRLRFPAWLTAALLLESGIVLSGSRTGLVHVGLAAIYALIAAFMARNASRGARSMHSTMQRAPALIVAAVVMVVGIVFLQPAIKAAGQAFDWHLFDTVAQLKAGDQVSARGALWAHALAMFRAHPLLGVGYGEFGWAQFQQMSQLRVTTEMSLHSHNAILDLLAKTGAVGAGGVALVLAGWFWRVVRARLWHTTHADRAQTVLVLVWLAMIGAHSMLEYPLHYLYFFLPFCFLLAWLEPAGFGKVRWPKTLSVAVGTAFVVLSGFVLVTLWQDYRRVEAREYASDERRDSLPLPEHWFRQHAASDVTERAVITPDNAAGLLPEHIAALHLLPTPNLIRRTAWLLALTDEPARARLWMERLRYYYQGDEVAQFNALDRDCDEVEPDIRPHEFCAWVRMRARRGHS